MEQEQVKIQESRNSILRLSKPWNDINLDNVSSGIISGILAVTGAPVIILEAASLGNFTYMQTITWIFAVHVMGGLLSILLPLYFRIPVTGGHTITGVAFLATVTAQFTYPQLIGGFIMSALLILLVGITGFFSKIMAWFPREIVASVLAGIIATYVVRLIPAAMELPLVGVTVFAIFFVLVKWFPRIPPVIGAIIVGTMTLLLTDGIQIDWTEAAFEIPVVQVPEFTANGFFSLALPLSLLILSNDAATSISSLKQNCFTPSSNKLVALSGISSLFTAFIGGHSANIAGMMSTICADSATGPKEQRYMASVLSGFVLILFGVFAWKLVPLIEALPSAFVNILAAFALIGVLGSSLQQGFSKEHLHLGSIFAFVIALSGVSLFNVSAPVWALFVGTLVAKTVAR